MTKRLWLFDVSPAGTALTNTNVRSDDNVAATGTGVTAGTGSLVSSTDSHIGFSAEFTANASSTVQSRLSFPAGTSAGAVSIYQKAASAPAITGSSTAQLLIARVRCTSGGIDILLRSNGTIVLANGSTVQASSTGVWTAGVRHRYDLSFTIGGSCTLDVFVGDSTSSIASLTVASGTSSGTTTAMDIGVLTSVLSATWVTTFDSIQMEDASTTQLGPYIEVNDPPAVTITANQDLAAGATFTATVSATDLDGSIASIAWSVLSGQSTSSPSLTGATTATVTGTVPAAGNLVVLQCIVTDNDGATTTKTTEIRVPKTGSFTTLALPHVGSWTNVGGATNGGTALRDGSDTTYVESPDYSGVETEVRARLEPLVPRVSLTLTPKSVVTATGGTTKVRLYEGATMRQEWTLTQNTSAATQTVTLSNPAGVTDWGNLWIAASAVA